MSSSDNTTLTQGIETLTTDELKARFQARTVPLEADFSDLIDVAECGRRAVGQNPAQTPNPNSGLMLDSGKQLVVKPDAVKGIEVTGSGVGIVANVAKGIAVDGNGVGVNTAVANGLTMDSNQLKVALPASNPGLELTTNGLQVKPNLANGMEVTNSGVGINTTVAKGLTMDSNQLKVALPASNPGLELTTNGLQVKPNLAKGMEVTNSGVGINTTVANGLTTAGNQLKVALPTSNPGLELTTNGLQVKPDAAKGMEVTNSGVGVVANTAKGVEVTSSGVGVVANAAKGIEATSSGVGVNTTIANGLTVVSNQLKVALHATPGLELTTTGLQVKSNLAKGIEVTNGGVGVNVDSTLRFANNQLGIPDNYVTKTGDSTITSGNLTFASDDKGVYFYGGSKIIKRWGANMLWYKGSNNALPQICNNDGSNASNIATESFIQRNTLVRDLSIPSPILVQIAHIPAGVFNGYAELHMGSRDTSGSYNYHQRFILTISCDGNAGYQGRSYALSVRNAYSTQHYGIAEVRLGRDGYGNVVVYCYITHTGTSLQLFLNYSRLHINDVELMAFPTISAPPTILDVINARVNGEING
ncbi:hypothetical protein D3C77_129520 [compost metagenome]